MIKETIVDNNTTAQLEVFFTKENTIRLYISDSEDPTNMHEVQFIDLDKSDTEYLILQLNKSIKYFEN